MAEYSHLSNLDPEFAAIAATIPSLPARDIPPSAVELRQTFGAEILKGIKAAYDPQVPPDSEYQLTDRQIDVDGAQVLCRCIVPTARTGEDKFPLVFWTHGGGWVMGELAWDDSRLRRLVVDRRIAVVNCEYRLAPEHPFPIPVNDSYACLKYFAAHPELVSADLSKGFLVAGISAGGNLAAVLAHLARDDPFFKEKPITGQLLSIPVTLHPDVYPEEYKKLLISFEQNKVQGMREMWDFYNSDPLDPKASPVLLPSHAGLAPAYIQVCGQDPLRDEGLLYEKLLREAGVKTKLEIYPGVPHGFDIVAPNISLGKKYSADIGNGIHWLLQGA
ncbi:hypothetical protein Moror_8140 [Moniliophthora roreri MCA 2997]|uniref:Alpha/beta hydrolase fold-3 domain-containing protein n=1 Tax=Moniliophthora roreri (strain MCA 2997) TaxID=1381753 RepID=V2XL67_MONRO|nr:hypothetical protein Moror_8140 [Moniliophthora roreri MCA 2997]